MKAKASKKEKKETGRPTKFKEEYCDKLKEHMSKGLSFESFAAIAEVDRDTLYHWTKIHPMFSDAKKQGRQLSLLFWESKGLEGLFNETWSEGFRGANGSRSLNASFWIFNMKNRFGWKDKIELTETDPDDNELEFDE